MLDEDIKALLKIEKSIVAILDMTHPKYEEIIAYVSDTLNEKPEHIFTFKASRDGTFPITHKVCFFPCNKNVFDKFTIEGEEKFGNSEKFIFLDGDNTSLKKEMNKLGIKLINTNDTIRKLNVN